MIAQQWTSPAPVSVAESEPRDQLRLQSIGWALAAGAVAGLPELVAAGLDPALRSAGCGFSMACWPFTCNESTPTTATYRRG